MMKQKTYRILLALVAAAAIGLGGWLWFYTRPVTLTQLCPTVRISQSAVASGGYLTVDGRQNEGGALVPTRGTFSFTAGGEALDQLIQLLKDAPFQRRVLPSHSSADAGSHLYQVGDIRWRIYFSTDQVIRDKEGNGNSGQLLQLDNFYGEITFYDMLDDKEWRLAADEALLQEVYDLLAKYGTPVEESQ